MKSSFLSLSLLLAGIARADAPAIVTQPADTLAGVGEDAALAAAVSGTAPLACQWFTSAGSPVVGAVSDTLALPAVTVTNAGSYYLVASNDFGCVTSRTARLVVCDKVWTGNGDGVSCLSGANWSGGTVPTSGDSVLIGEGSNTVNFAGGTLGNLLCRRNMNWQDSTTVTGLVNVSVIYFKAGSTVTVNGLAAKLNSEGTTTVSYVTFNAIGGAVVTLNGLNSLYVGSHNLSWTASGTGSQINFPSLVNMSGPGSDGCVFLIKAISGGVIKLGTQTITTGNNEYGGGARGTQVLADGTNSVVDLGALVSFSDGNSVASNSSMEPRNGGQIVATNLASVSGVSLTVSGGMNFSLPALTSYSCGSRCTRYIQASGAGSVLNLPTLQTITGPGSDWCALYIQAVSGGLVNCGQATSILAGGNIYGSGARGTQVLADGTNSVVDLGALVSFSGGNDVASNSSMEPRNGGQIVATNLASVSGVSLTVSGGMNFSLPALTSYSCGSRCTRYIQASGDGSVLDLPKLQTITGPGSDWCVLYVQALSGGLLNLRRVSHISNGSNVYGSGPRGTVVLGDGAGSIVDLTGLVVFSDDPSLGNSCVREQNGGRVLRNLAVVYNGVDVYLLPYIYAHPQDSTVLIYSNATFFVTADGTTPLTYRWYFGEGTQIGAGTSASLTVTNVQESDAGDYWVTVSNVYGVVTSEVATLSLATAPVIMQQPLSLRVVAGESAAFSVEATGNPMPHYQWRCNGVEIPGATGATYVVSSTGYSEAGQYDVIVMNVAGAVTSESAWLALTLKATGGEYRTDGTNAYHVFKASGAFQVQAGGVLGCLVVAGGGQGGGRGDKGGGGGGAGGLIYDPACPVASGQTIMVTVGVGGSGAGANQIGYNGQNSVFGTLTAIGGGGGAAGPPGSGSAQHQGQGGGSGGGSSEGRGSGGSGVVGQGFPGGRCDQTGGRGGGGGGAGEQGKNSSVGAGGGNGRFIDIQGTNVWYAGGGAGGDYWNGTGGICIGGLGGGGNSASAGTPNTGGGGGGGKSGSAAGGAGGSGIVIIRYPLYMLTSQLTVTGFPQNVGTALPYNYGSYAVERGKVVTNFVSSPASGGWGTQYVSKGWIGTGSIPSLGGGTNVTFALTNDSTIAWQWQTQYRLVSSTNGSGYVTAGGWYNSGSNVTLTAVDAAYSHFAGWSGDTNGCTLASNTITVVMSQARTIVATFLPEPRMLTVFSPFGGASPGTLTTNYNTVLSQFVTNSPAAGGVGTQYVCVAGSLIGNAYSQIGTTNIVLTLTNNATLTWQWATNYWLEVETNGPGRVSGGDKWVRGGTSATLSAAAAANYRFASWSGDTSAIQGGTVSNENVTVNVNGSVSLLANFVFDRYIASSNLLLWLRADAILGVANGQGVSYWPDLSVYGRSVTPYRATPVFTTGALNGKPAVRFSGLSSFQIADSPVWRLQNLTIFVVAKRNAPVCSYDWWTGIMIGQNQGSGANPKWSMGFTTDLSRNSFCLSDNTLGSVETSFSLPFDQYGLFELHKDGPRKEGYYRGRLTDSSDSAGTGAMIDVAAPLTIGFWESVYDPHERGDSGFQGAIAEVLIYNSSLSDEQRQEVGSYLSGKYGFTGSYTLPAISQHPRSQVIPLGTNTSFNVAAFGTMPLSYQWSFNSTNLFGETNMVLNLANIQATDAGSYRAIVSNPLGCVTSSVGTLTLATCPVITTHPTNVAVRVGGQAVFKVTATGNPSPGYQWRHAGTNMAGKTSSTLALASTTVADRGFYDVVVANSAGAVVSDSAQLTFGYYLSVVSPYGAPEPPAGTQTWFWGNCVTCRVSSAETSGTRQYACKGWIGTGSVPTFGGTNSLVFNITNDSSIVWQWVTNYWLTVETNGPGHVTGGDRWVLAGSNATLTAHGDVNWHFVSWSGDIGAIVGGVTDATVVVTMNTPVTLVANFGIDCFPVTFDLGPHGTRAGGGELSQSVEYGGAAVAPEVQAEQGWAFEGWDTAFGCVTNALTVRAVYAPQVVVANVTASQRPGTKLVDIGYDLYYGGTNALTVGVAVSNTTGVVSASTLSGDVGAGVTNGAGRHIVWDTGADQNGLVLTGLCVQVSAGNAVADAVSGFDLDSRDYTITVDSARGSPTPAVGLHTNYCWRSAVTCAVEVAVSEGGTNWTCVGWTGTGSVQPEGWTTNLAAVLTNVASAVTWNWVPTAYYVQAGTGTGGGGAVTGGGEWVAPGGYAVLTATPDAGYRFWHWTDGTGTVVGENSVYTNWVTGAGTFTGWFLSLPTAVIDSVEPAQPVEGAEIALSGHGSGEYAVEGYCWSVERLVDGVPDGQARAFCWSQTAVTTLPAGAWRISFQVCDAMESWSAPVTRDVTVASAATLSDLQASREDVRFFNHEGHEGHEVGSVRTGETVSVVIAVHNTGSAETPGPVRVMLYEGFGPTNLTSQTPAALTAVATGIVAYVAAGGVETVSLPWIVAGAEGQRTLTVVAEYAANYEAAVSNGVHGLSAALPVTERTLDNNLASAMVTVGDLALPPNLLNVTVQAGTMVAGRTGTVGGRATYGWGQAYPVLGALVEVEIEGVSYVTHTRSPDGSFAVAVTAPAVGVRTATARVYDGFAVGSTSCAFSCVPVPSGGGGGGGGRYWPPAAPPTAPNLVVEAVAVGGSGVYEAESGVPHAQAVGSVTVRALVRNASGFPCADDFAVTFGAGGVPLGVVTVAGGLGPNEARWVEAPTNWLPVAVGTMAVTAEADSAGAVAELSETDNSRSQAVAVREPKPDLRPYRIVWNGSGWNRQSGLGWTPSEPVVGTDVQVMATIHNCGTLPSGQPFDVALLCDGIEVARSSVAESMGVAESREVKFLWTTAAVPPGAHALEIVVDAAGEVAEDYESNNATAVSLRLYPDAAAPVPFDLTVSPYPTVGDPCVLTAHIRNGGGAAYPGGVAAFYVESPAHAPLGEGAVGALAAKGGEGGSAGVMWRPAAVGPVRVYVSVEGQIYSEVFNVGEIPPDLRVLSEDLALDPGAPGVGDNVRVRASVRNAGASVAATNVCVRFEIAAGGGVYVPLGTPRWIGALAPGESRMVDASALLPAVGRGVYIVRVTLDAAGQGEADEGDNAATRSFGVELPVADAGADRGCVLGETVTLDGGGSSNASNYRWRVADRPAGSAAGLAGAETATPAFTPDVGGNYRLALAVSAGGVTSAPSEVAVCVTGVVITASAGAHGAVSPSGAVVAATGSRPAFALTPEPGYRVAEVLVDGVSVAAGETYTFEPVLLNHALEARFAAASNTLTVVSAHGAPEPAAGVHTFPWGTRVASRVSLVEDYGATQYVCLGWAGTGSVQPEGWTTNTYATLTNDSSIAWCWQTNYLLSVTVSGSGSVAGVTGFLPAGSESALEAEPGEGFVFAGWSGDLAGCAVHAGVVTARVGRARELVGSFRPMPVSGLSAQVTGLNSVGLTWGYGGLASAQFRVERQVGGGEWQTLGTVAGLAFADGTVAEGQSLRYRVTATVGAFDSASAEVTAEVPHLPAVPSGVGATAVSSDAVSVFWSAAARATGYAVQRRSLPLGEWAAVAALGNVTGWSDVSVAAGGRYAYRVRGVNAAGNSAFSTEVSVTVPDEPGQWGYGLLVSNVAVTVSGEAFTPEEGVLCGALMGGVFDALLSNPAGVRSQHRVVVGLRDTNGVAVGTAVEVSELTGVPSEPPVWVTAVTVPVGLRVPAEPGLYVLWAEDDLGNGDPREAFAGVAHTNETALARVLGAFEAEAPDAAQAHVRLDTVSERAGRTVELPISVAAMGGENAFSFSLVYDPSKLRILNIRPGDAMAASYMEVNDEAEGAVGVLMLLPLDAGLAAGQQGLATVRFQIDGAVPPGVPIKVAFGDEPGYRMVVDAYANPLPHVWVDGAVNVAPPGYEADVSPRGRWDERVNDKDKSQIMRFAIGLDTPAAGEEFQRADCAPIETRGDGRVDVRDAVVATRYAGGAEPLKDVGGPAAPLGVARESCPLEIMGGTPMPLGDSQEWLLAQGLMGLLKLEASFGVRGEVVEVPVSVVSGGTVEGASFSVGFDPGQLVFLEAVPALACSNALTVLNATSAAAGTLSYALRMPPGRGLPAGSVNVLTLRFRVAQAAGDAITSLEFLSEPAAVVLSDRAGGTISASVQGADVYLLRVTAAGAPAVVEGLEATVEGGTRVRLVWGGAAGATGYALYRRSDRESWGLLAELAADGRGYVDSGLEPGLAYAYRIAAVNADGESSGDPVTVVLPTPYRYWADTRIGVSLGEPGGDADGDGTSNYLEYLMGSDPVAREAGLLRTGLADIYGLGDAYFTLSLDVNDWALPSLSVDTTGDLRSGVWAAASEVSNVAVDGKRRLTYRSQRPVTEAPAQFIRVRTDP